MKDLSGLLADLTIWEAILDCPVHGACCTKIAKQWYAKSFYPVC